MKSGQFSVNELKISLAVISRTYYIGSVKSKIDPKGSIYLVFQMTVLANISVIHCEMD